MTGAVCLAAQAAFRADAGYVAVAVPEQSLPVVETVLLEPVKLTWDGRAARAAEKAGALAIGPGLGRDAAARSCAPPCSRPATRRSCSTPTHSTSSSPATGAHARW